VAAIFERRVNAVVRGGLILSAIGLVLWGVGLFDRGHATIRVVGFCTWAGGFLVWSFCFAHLRQPRRQSPTDAN
jgi:hypothetical protein